MAPVTMPVLAVGLLTCVLVEKLALFGYGAKLPDSVRAVLENHSNHEADSRDERGKARIITQAVVGVVLIMALAFHVAEIGLIGLTVIILLTALNGVISEHQIGKAFEEALPFTALLCVFFSIVAVIHEQHLFQPSNPSRKQ